MARRIGPQVKVFLDILYTKHSGAASAAALEAGYESPMLTGRRLRRKYSDLCEAARLAWIEKTHVSYEEALKLLGEVARNKEHREQVRAITTILELQGAKQNTDPAQLRREVTGLLKQLQVQRSLPSGSKEIIDVELEEAENIIPQPVA